MENTSLQKKVSYFLASLLLISFFSFCSFVLLRVFINNSILFFQNTPAFNIVEGLSLYLSQQALKGLPLYTSIFEYPYTLNLYPPIYPLIGSVFLRVFSDSILSLRALTVLSEVVIGVLCALIIYKKTKNFFISAIFIPIIYGLLAVNKFHGIARIDFITLAFSVAALASYIYALESANRLTRILYVVFSLLTLFSKQTGVVVFATCFFHTALLLKEKTLKQNKLLFLEHTIIIVIYLLISTVLILMTKGEYFKQNFVYQFMFGFYDSLKVQNVVTFSEMYGFLFFWLILSVIKSRDLLLLIYIWLSITWMFFSFEKNGADQNYALETLITLLLCIAYMFGKTVNVRKWSLYLVIFLLFLINVAYQVNKKGFAHQQFFNKEISQERTKINQLVRNSQGLILSIDSLVLIQNNKKVLTYDPFMIWAAFNIQKIPLQSFLANFKQGKVELVVDSYAFAATPEIKSILDKDYLMIYKSKVQAKDGGWQVYRRKQLLTK